jgi:hypothetical protein
VQLDILYHYRRHVELYPHFQAWLRESEVKVLAVWGKNDQIFVKEGAEAFRRDVSEERLRGGVVGCGAFCVGDERI